MSSDRPKRATKRIDYRIYNETGRKVVTERNQVEKVVEKFKNLSIMASERLVEEEEKVSLKICRFLDENELDALFDIEEVELGIAEIKRLIKSYEEIHVQLKKELGDEYKNKCQGFDENSKGVSTWIKNAKTDIKKKKEEKLRREKEEKEEQRRREKVEQRTFAES